MIGIDELKAKPKLQAPILALFPALYLAWMLNQPKTSIVFYFLKYNKLVFFLSQLLVVILIFIPLHIHMYTSSGRRQELFTTDWLIHLGKTVGMIAVLGVPIGGCLIVASNILFDVRKPSSSTFLGFMLLAWFPAASLFLADIWEKGPDLSRRSPQRSRHVDPALRKWKSDGIQNHDGKDIAPDLVFFAPPANFLGELLSCYSTLREDDVPLDPNDRKFYIIIISVIMAGFGYYILPSEIDIISGKAVWGGLFAVSGLVSGLICSAHIHYCNFVGSEGFIEYKLKGSNANIVITEKLCFNTAKDCFAKLTENYTNSFYTHTKYEFTWYDDIDAGNSPLAKLSGQFNKNDPHVDYHFAAGARAAWALHRQLRMANEIETSGKIDFPVVRKLKSRICLYPDEFYFLCKDDSHREKYVNLKADVKDGKLLLWFPNPNKKGESIRYSIPAAAISNIDNLRLFLKARS